MLGHFHRIPECSGQAELLYQYPPSVCIILTAANRDTAVPAEGNGDLQTLICVFVARPRRCLTLLNPVPWQNWMAAYLGYTLRMRTLFRGWPIMVNDTYTRRRRRLPLFNWHTQHFWIPFSRFTYTTWWSFCTVSLQHFCNNVTKFFTFIIIIIIVIIISLHHQVVSFSQVPNEIYCCSIFCLSVTALM